HISARGPAGWGRRTLPLRHSRASFAYQPVWWRRRRTWRPAIGEQDDLKGVRWLLKVVGPVPVDFVLTVPKDGELPMDVKMMADQITRLIEAEYS
ncbi:MAG: hypothetical protein GY778_14360, partial [bacterium]|nr:hypothetical protein [bacterium]